RVLDDVVQERGRNRLLVEVELRADPGGAERVEHEVVPRAALLARVGLGGEAERAREQVAINRRVVRGHLRDQLVDEVLMRLVRLQNGHTEKCTPGFRRLSVPGTRD